MLEVGAFRDTKSSKMFCVYIKRSSLGSCEGAEIMSLHPEWLIDNFGAKQVDRYKDMKRMETEIKDLKKEINKLEAIVNAFGK